MYACVYKPGLHNHSILSINVYFCTNTVFDLRYSHLAILRRCKITVAYRLHLGCTCMQPAMVKLELSTISNVA